MADKFDTFSDLLRAALGSHLAPADDMLDLFTDDIVFEFPFAPEGLPTRFEGRDALTGHLAKLGPLLSLGEMELHAVYPSGDTVIAEFSCKGRGVQTGLPYDQNYVSVITLRDERIARYRDYWNPLVVLAALGGADAANAAFSAAGS
ncbi:MAG: nuclear transport factor 2 family protein [Loktanella sp.]|nr:nuclear transport factor 2 family protein [Loktanella sp.]